MQTTHYMYILLHLAILDMTSTTQKYIAKCLVNDHEFEVHRNHLSQLISNIKPGNDCCSTGHGDVTSQDTEGCCLTST